MHELIVEVLLKSPDTPIMSKTDEGVLFEMYEIASIMLLSLDREWCYGSYKIFMREMNGGSQIAIARLDYKEDGEFKSMEFLGPSEEYDLISSHFDRAVQEAKGDGSNGIMETGGLSKDHQSRRLN